MTAGSVSRRLPARAMAWPLAKTVASAADTYYPAFSPPGEYGIPCELYRIVPMYPTVGAYCGIQTEHPADSAQRKIHVAANWDAADAEEARMRSDSAGADSGVRNVWTG